MASMPTMRTALNFLLSTSVCSHYCWKAQQLKRILFHCFLTAAMNQALLKISPIYSRSRRSGAQKCTQRRKRWNKATPQFQSHGMKLLLWAPPSRTCVSTAKTTPSSRAMAAAATARQSTAKCRGTRLFGRRFRGRVCSSS